MPRTSKKDRIVLKKNETKNKKRKRTEEDIDVSGNNKRLKMGWIRDIKAVLRSAGNRLVHIESSQRLESRKKSKNVTGETKDSVCIGNTDEVDKCNNNVISFSDNEAVGSLTKCLLESQQSTTTLERSNFEDNIRNTECEDDDISFRKLECKASGTLIRLEKVSSNSSANRMVWKEVDDTPGSSGSISDIDKTENQVIQDDNVEDSIRLLVDELNKSIYMMNDINEVVPKQNDDLNSTTNNLNENDSNVITNDSNVITNDSNVITINDSNYNKNGYCDQLNTKNVYTDVTYIIDNIRQDGIISDTNESTSGSNRISCNSNNDDGRCNVINSSSDEDNCNEFRVNRCCGDCSDDKCPCNVLDVYKVPFFDDLNSDEKKECEGTLNYPIAQAYYDSNRSAFVESTALQENKPNSSTKSLKNTWGSIKSLISRVSGQRGSGDKAESPTDDAINQTDDDLYA